jgi:hypothetical protein
MDIFKRAAAAAAAAAVFSLSLPVYAYGAGEAHYTVTAPISEENGVLTLADGQKWYKVNSFEDENDYIICVKGSDGRQMLFTAADDNYREYIWHYYRRTMVTSVAPRYTTLSNSYHLTYHDGQLYTVSNWWNDGDSVWDYSGGALSYNENGNMHYLRYSEGSSEPFSCTDNIGEAAQVCIYAKGAQLSRCISRHPAAESYVLEGSGYAAPEFSVELSDKNIITDSVKWFVDGKEQDCAKLTFTADSLVDKPAGVHRVGCLIEGHDSDGVHYRERSADGAFVIAKGVMPDSFMSFSDIHEQYEFIDRAIEKIMERTGGYIPSLVVCTGDLANGPTVDKDTMLSRYYPQIVSHLGGLDAVFASGNHDSGEAASIMSLRAGLGADCNTRGAGGQIFRGLSDGVKNKGRNSRFAKGIIVYGLNFESALYFNNNEYTYSYDRTLGELESFLKKTAESYNGELVVISAHSGLHVLGLQPQSVNANGVSIGKWIGENQYNIDRSDEMAKLINSYAEKYDMDIMYLFGHDHSRSETEFILSDGDELISTKKYSDGTYDRETLSFTYGHSGFLSTTIGSASARFSFIYRDGDHYSYDILNLNGDIIRRREIAAKSTFTEPAVTTAAASAAVTTSATSKAKLSADSPKTGDRSAAVFAAVPAAVFVLILSMKKKEK